MSPLILRRHYPSKIKYWVSDDGPSKPMALSVGFNATVGSNKENPLDWRVTMSVKFSAKAEETEYANGEITFVGYFNLPENVADAERQNFALRNGASVLYSSIRELIANLSARSPHIIVNIPPATFSNLTIPSDAPKDQITVVSPN